MLARTAAAASLPFIFARPFSEQATDLPVVTLDAQAAVIVVDDSASMQRLSGGGTLFGRARARAQALARQFPSDSELAFLVTSAGSPPRIGELEPDRARVIEAIEGARCSSRPADFTSAMRQAALILAPSQRAHKGVYLFTDLQATGWEDGAGLPAEGAPEVIIDDVAAGAALENRAIVEAHVEPSAEGGPGGIAVTAEIADFSAHGAPALGVTLRVDGVCRGARGGRAFRRRTRTQALSAQSTWRWRLVARLGGRDRQGCVSPRRPPANARGDGAHLAYPGRRRRSAHHPQ
jgi:hypothetical protein